MSELLDTIKELNQDVMRNIVNILDSHDVFSDLLSNQSEAALIADKMINRVNSDNHLQFHYTAAIAYPFETDSFMSTRYSDGSFPVWYGSLDTVTTIYETVHHMIQTEMQISGIENHKMIIRDRMVYSINCQSVLIDLTKKAKRFSDLISDNYSFTQALGKKLKKQGFPGLLSSSARYNDGININIFKQEILNNPRVSCELSYQLSPALKKVEVYNKDTLLNVIEW